MLNNQKIEYLSQTEVINSKREIFYILRNENLVFECINKKLKKNATTIINFSNVDKAFFVGLINISNPSYLNAIIQNFINIDILTKYFLIEKYFKFIINNSKICQFTCFYLEILKNMCCENVTEFYDLKDFNEIIYLINSNFKFNKNYTPGDLIKFILEKIYKEMNQLTLNLNKNNIINTFINNNIISNSFTYIKNENIECKNCKYVINNYQ